MASGTIVSEASLAAANPAARNVAGLWIAPPLLVLAGLFFYPLALITLHSFKTASGSASIDPYLTVLSSALFYAALLHTIAIALAATAGCLLLGAALALVLTFVPFPGMRLLGRLIDVVIALPTFLVALAFTFIYGSAGLVNAWLMRLWHTNTPPLDFLYSIWGVIFAEITVYTPFIMRPLLASLSLIEPAQIEIAGSLGAGPWRIIRTVILPAAMPALLAGGSLCLLLTVNEFGIVFFIGAKGVTTLPLLIYDKAIQEFDYSTACVIAVVNIILSLTLFALYRLVLSRLGDARAGMV